MRSKIYITLLVIAMLILPCSICKAETLELIGQGAVYNPLPDPSNNNALRAAEQINKKTVNPVEIFSFYDYVLPSIENGYQEGLSMYQTSRGTELLPDIGGGICKTATALNFAVQNTGLEAVEIHRHTNPVSYAAPGQDVAVSRSAGWGTTDSGILWIGRS